MGKIVTLKKDVYEKIAAGEVVENPFSVVKELTENSLDAGADKIKVELRSGGKDLIKVIDNGCGFSEEDIEVAFKRHSTSKFKTFSDFESLNTLGFRGEALPSILEVSRISIETSDNNTGDGYYCKFSDGKLIEKTKIPFPMGTTFTVKDLFYNFPVRKKFLKGDRSELNKILSFFETLVLAHYDKTFELYNNGKLLFYYEKVKSIIERVYQVFGKEFASSLIPVDFSEGNYKINAVVSKINTGVGSKKYQFFFVNGRGVSEKTLFASLNNTFKSFLEKSRSPVSVMLLEVPPSEVDVNIHPMKLEIKFEDPQKIYRFVNHAIRSVFSDNRSAETYDYNNRFEKRSSDFVIEKPDEEKTEIVQSLLFEDNDVEIDDFIIIGQYQDSYIIVEKESDLLIVDQHNADERVNFDKLMKSFRENKVVSVSPLFPLVLELSPSESIMFDEKKAEILNRSGFEISTLGGNSFDIKKYPEILSEKRVKETVKNIINQDLADERFEEKVLAEIACKSSIKVNYKLHTNQMQSVVRRLFKSSNPYFCPHKRPIIVNFSLEKIEKLLKRR